MRAWWWLVAAVAVVAGVGVSPVEAQRGSSSRLAQLMQEMVASVGNVASRIGNGMIKSVGGNNRPQVLRQSPQALPLPSQPARLQRQRIVHPFEDGQTLQENQAPNVPRPLRQRVEKPAGGGRRRRLSFRQFVDTTMAGIAHLIPRIRRRVQNRRRHTRELEFH